MEKTFNIKCTMEERWIDSFLSMLRYMEACGKIGHSTLIGFYSDGDGDFRPLFEPDVQFNRDDGYVPERIVAKSLRGFMMLAKSQPRLETLMIGSIGK